MNPESIFNSAAEIQNHFQSIKNAPLSDLQENAAGEYMEISSVSAWVHITLIRFEDDSRRLGIEVEVSLPSGSCGESFEESAQMNLLQGMMTHIVFIKNLLKLGFKLSVIREDCLWVASYLTSEDPPLEVFEALVPPIVN